MASSEASERLRFMVDTPPGSQGVTALGLGQLLDEELGFPPGTVRVESVPDQEARAERCPTNERGLYECRRGNALYSEPCDECDPAPDQEARAEQRCETCGSLDPSICRKGRGSGHPHGDTDGTLGPCCPDEFHLPAPDRGRGDELDDSDRAYADALVRAAEAEERAERAEVERCDCPSDEPDYDRLPAQHPLVADLARDTYVRPEGSEGTLSDTEGVGFAEVAIGWGSDEPESCVDAVERVLGEGERSKPPKPVEIAGYHFAPWAGWWDCADHGRFSAGDSTYWAPGGTPQCPAEDCRRTDTLQWFPAFTVKSIASKLAAERKAREQAEAEARWVEVARTEAKTCCEERDAERKAKDRAEHRLADCASLAAAYDEMRERAEAAEQQVESAKLTESTLRRELAEAEHRADCAEDEINALTADVAGAELRAEQAEAERDEVEEERERYAARLYEAVQRAEQAEKQVKSATRGENVMRLAERWRADKRRAEKAEAERYEFEGENTFLKHQAVTKDDLARKQREWDEMAERSNAAREAAERERDEARERAERAERWAAYERNRAAEWEANEQDEYHRAEQAEQKVERLSKQVDGLRETVQRWVNDWRPADHRAAVEGQRASESDRQREEAERERDAVSRDGAALRKRAERAEQRAEKAEAAESTLRRELALRVEEHKEARAGRDYFWCRLARAEASLAAERKAKDRAEHRLADCASLAAAYDEMGERAEKAEQQVKRLLRGALRQANERAMGYASDLATLRERIAEHVEWLDAEREKRNDATGGSYRSGIFYAYSAAADHARSLLGGDES